MKNLKNLTKEVKETLKNNIYNVEAEYCHPERVPEEALEIAVETAVEYFQKVSDQEIKDYCEEAILSGEPTVDYVLTMMADRNSDHGVYTTITTVAYKQPYF